MGVFSHLVLVYFLVVFAAHQWHFVNFTIMILFICNSGQLSPFFTGAYYFDNTSQKEKEDDKVLPNSEHVYYWEVTSDVAPQKNDPTCLTYTYISHQNVVRDYNSGLIGTLLICKQGKCENVLILCVFFILHLEFWSLFFSFSLGRHSRWIRAAGWHPPRVCISFWGFWWEQEQIRA